MELGEKIKIYREKNNLSIEDLSNILGVSCSEIVKMEEGNITLLDSLKVYTALGIPLEDFSSEVSNKYGIQVENKEIQNMVVSIGSRIQEARNQLGVSQLDLAIRLDTELKAIKDYEEGRVTPDLKILKDTAKAFNVPISWLMGDKEDCSLGECTPLFKKKETYKGGISLYFKDAIKNCAMIKGEGVLLEDTELEGMSSFLELMLKAKILEIKNRKGV